MLSFPIHTIDSSEGERKDLLERITDTYGFVPNLLGAMVESPATARAYVALGAEVASNTTLTVEERTVAWFAVIKANNCHYCLPAHTAQAVADKVDASVVEAARNTGKYASARLQTLHDFVHALVETRGRPGESSTSAFQDAGYSAEQALECVLIVAQKTLSNFVNALVDTPVDDVFKGFENSVGETNDDTAMQRTLSNVSQ